jgi:hypothetical protein
MAGINDYSNTPSLNTTINTIDVDEGCNPANINDAIRQLMADIADVDDGVIPLQTPDINGGTIDGAVIGGTTAAAGTFTTVTATSFSGDGSGLTGISAGIDEVTAGSGLTGGGSSGSVTLNVGAGALIDVTADAIDVDLSELTTSTSDADGDFFVVVDSANAQKKLTKANIAISGFNNDSGFINGSSLNASNLSSGTVPDARFPATLPAISGANLTNLDASDLASGTVPDARFPATLPAISGANLTSLNATNIASGTLSADRLPTVPTTKGGTGLTTIGTANQVLAVNSGGTALEYQTPTTVDITGVTAGSGLTGGGTTGDVTLNVGAGTGISVAADTVGLATAGPGAGTYGSTDDATKIDTITLDAYGRVTAVATGATGDIAGVTAGTNLTGGGTSGTVTLNLNSDIVLTSIGLGNRVTLSESSDRADLLAVTGTTSSWAGVCIKNTSNEVITSFMAEGTQFGLYDDQQNEWAILCNENAAVELYHNGSKKLETTSSGILVTGGVDMNASWGEVGTYSAMKNHSTASTINPGQTVAGSTLRVANYSGGILGNTFIPTGTWRAMGWAATSNSNNNAAETTLFFRIS